MPTVEISERVKEILEHFKEKSGSKTYSDAINLSLAKFEYVDILQQLINEKDDKIKSLSEQIESLKAVSIPDKSSKQETYNLKICMLGEANVGKTSLVYRYANNTFEKSYKATLGVNLVKVDFRIENVGNIGLQIWDLGGQEVFKRMHRYYLGGANGALLVFDLTKRDSFEKLAMWYGDFREINHTEPVILIGNKNDLADQFEVSIKEARQFADENKIGFISASAKTGNSVKEAFLNIAETILPQYVNRNR